MLKKYLVRTSSSGYLLLSINDNEDAHVATFRDDTARGPLYLISQAREVPEHDRTYWQQQIFDAVPLKAVSLK